MAVKIRICMVTFITFFMMGFSSVQAADSCREWADYVCEALGVKLISCGYDGPALTAQGLVLEKSTLESQGFFLYDGSYFATVYRIDAKRYRIGLKSLSDRDAYQERIVQPDEMLESYVPDLRPKGPYGYYYWNAAIQYDLLHQAGFYPTGGLPAKMIKQAEVMVVAPHFAHHHGFTTIKKGQILSLNYISQDRWHITDPKTKKGFAMRYSGTVWTVTGKISAITAIKPRPVTAAVTRNLLFENSDFEYGDLTNWQTDSGDAFLYQPTLGDNVLARQRGNSKHAGKYWIGTYERYNERTGTKPGRVQGDRPMGTLTSIPFVIKSDKISFLIGGGRRITSLYAALVVDGQEILKTTGFNSENMRRVTWDVSRFKNRTAQIRIQDQSFQAFGHINVDDFRYAEAPAKPAAAAPKPVILKPIKKTVPAVSSAPAQTPTSNPPAEAKTQAPADDEIPDIDVPENEYDGWFPFPEYGWTALSAQSRSAGGALLEVKKTYTRIKDQAVLTIRVKKDKSGANTTTGSRNQDPIQGLFGTLLGEVLKDKNDTSTTDDSPISHQGVTGTLTQAGNTVTISFKDSGYEVTLRLNRNEPDTARAYLGMLDFGTLTEVF